MSNSKINITGASRKRVMGYIHEGYIVACKSSVGFAFIKAKNNDITSFSVLHGNTGFDKEKGKDRNYLEEVFIDKADEMMAFDPEDYPELAALAEE